MRMKEKGTSKRVFKDDDERWKRTEEEEEEEQELKDAGD